MITREPIPTEAKSIVGDYLANHDVAKRGKFDGDYEKQYTGLLGEVMFHYWLFGYYPDLSDNGFDGGFDMEYLGEKIDVKTMGRNTDVKMHYANNFQACQMDYESDIVVFCSINKKENMFQICGYLPKRLLQKKGELHHAGTMRHRSDGSSFVLKDDTYEINNIDLIPIHYLKIYHAAN